MEATILRLLPMLFLWGIIAWLHVRIARLESQLAKTLELLVRSEQIRNQEDSRKLSDI